MFASASDIHTSLGGASSSAPSSFCSNVRMPLQRTPKKSVFKYLSDPLAALLVAIGKVEHARPSGWLAACKGAGIEAAVCGQSVTARRRGAYARMMSSDGEY